MCDTTEFPLDFSQLVGIWLNTLLKALIIFTVVVAAVTIIVHLARFYRQEAAPRRSDPDRQA